MANKLICILAIGLLLGTCGCGSGAGAGVGLSNNVSALRASERKSSSYLFNTGKSRVKSPSASR